MSTNIVFDENKYKIKSRSTLGSPEVSTIIRLMIKSKIVKNKNQASVMILFLIIICLGLSFYFINLTFINQPTVDYTNLIEIRN